MTHYFHEKRDKKREIRELKVRYLLEAYRRLESASNRTNRTPEQTQMFEDAIADIQLFGTKQQIEILNRFMLDQVKNQNGSIKPVLVQLRNDLRTELGDIEEVPDPVFFRFE